MFISQDNAMQIVSEISGIIGQKVNLMDEEGIIIASTDPVRIGQYHGAAKRVIDEKLEELVIHDDSEYEGSRQGINLPVLYNGRPVGVIGVTGDYAQVVKYGQIIKKMTEILLHEYDYRERAEMENEIRTRFMEEWVCSGSCRMDASLEERGLALGIDITIPRRILLLSIVVKQAVDSLQEQKLLNSAEQEVHAILSKDRQSVVIRSAAGIICAVKMQTDQQLEHLAKRLKSAVEKKFPVLLAVGADSPVSNYANLHNAYLKARKALQSSQRSKDKAIRFYDNINMEIFSGEIPDAVKEEFIRRIFKGCTPDEIVQWILLLEIFYEEEGSISATSERLFIHKNTLQYKLKKLREKTGYDPRSIRYSSLYYIAIYFYRSINEHGSFFSQAEG